MHSQRTKFGLPNDVVYLNCANMSPQLHSVASAAVAALRRARAPWMIRSRDWFTGAEELRSYAARLLGASANNVALVPAVSYGIATAASNIPIARGQNIVILAEQFPSNVYAWRAVAKDTGAEVRTVRRGALDDWTEAVLSAIDADTAVVAVPQHHWIDGAHVDLRVVGSKARAEGAALVVDVSQSFGASPLDVAAIQPDFLVSVGYKWQLGPYGIGYLYVSPHWCDNGRPLEASWLARAGADDFAGLTDYQEHYRAGARRFDMGGYPQFFLVPMAVAALRQVHEWGIDSINERIAALTESIATEAAAMELVVLPAHKRARHFVGLRLPGGIRDEIAQRLRAERVYVSVRGDAIRVAPHVYNDDGDVRRFLDVLRGVV